MQRREPSWFRALASGPRGKWLAKALARRMLATLEGEEHLPLEGPALLVGNHGLFGTDSVALAALVVERTGRMLRFLGERNLWRVPGLRDFLDGVGAVPGGPDAAVALLRAGELVVVYPGGVDDSFKLSSEAYRLKWGQRAGFARVAMRAAVPIVPVAGLGIDDLYEVRSKEAWLGRRLLGSSRYDLPLPENLLPKRVPLAFQVLSPIATEGDPDSAACVERVRAETYAALDAALATRRGGG